MAQLAAVAQAASGALSAVGTIAAGQAAADQGKFQRDQFNQQAGQERAMAQRSAIEERRQSRLMQSRQQAVAAASGAGAMDKTILDIMGDTEAGGAYRALTSLYQGEERAKGLELQGETAYEQGRSARKASYIEAAGTIAGSAASLYDRFAPSETPGVKPPSRRRTGAYPGRYG